MTAYRTNRPYRNTIKYRGGEGVYQLPVLRNNAAIAANSGSDTNVVSIAKWSKSQQADTSIKPAWKLGVKTDFASIANWAKALSADVQYLHLFKDLCHEEFL